MSDASDLTVYHIWIVSANTNMRVNRGQRVSTSAQIDVGLNQISARQLIINLNDGFSGHSQFN